MFLFGPPNVEKLKAKKDITGLIKALSYTKDGNICRYAAGALGTIGDAQAVEPLIATLKDSRWPLREAAAQALGQIRDTRAVEPLIAALKDSAGCVREATVTALGRIRDSRAVEPLLVARKDNDPDLRKAAANALGQIGDPRAIAPLVAALKDHELKVRRVAADALVKLGASSVALEDNESNVREAAVQTLDKLGWKPDESKAAAWYWMTKRNWDQCVRLGPAAIDPLIVALKDGDSSVRQAAVQALMQIGDTRAVEPIVAALKDKEWKVRQAATDALVKFGALSVDPLIVALKDSDSSVRQAAAQALDKLGWKPDEGEAGAWYWVTKKNWDQCVRLGAPAVEPLIVELKAFIYSVDRALVEVLGQLRDTRAMEPLIAALDASGGVARKAVRKTIVTALGQIGDPRAIGRLTQAAQWDDSPGVRRRASRSLEWIRQRQAQGSSGAPDKA